MRVYVLPKKLIVKDKYRGVEVTDLFVVIISFIVAVITGFNVYKILRPVYYFFIVGVTIVGILPSQDVFNKKNYEVVTLLLKRDTKVYHSI